MYSYISALDTHNKTFKKKNKPRYVFLKGQARLNRNNNQKSPGLNITRHYLGMINKSNFGIITNHLSFHNLRTIKRPSKPLNSYASTNRLVPILNSDRESKYQTIPLHQYDSNNAKEKDNYYRETFTKFFRDKMKMSYVHKRELKKTDAIFNQTNYYQKPTVLYDQFDFNNLVKQYTVRESRDFLSSRDNVTLNQSQSHSLYKLKSTNTVNSSMTQREVIQLKKNSSQQSILPYEAKYIEKGVNVTGFFCDDSGDNILEDNDRKYGKTLLIGSKKKWLQKKS